ncbi:GlxA family transcriptional regulator [Phaeobacter gallaeciensis]|uniref:GlxA family transcriptional regulator n=2 Tax=Roseobacteraceae TaxID=2854170 RepID=A0A366X8M6_9RHOB|nr:MULTISPECIES: GlxA family transcriptional regulator [Roseobacteraceae]MBT3139549.1 GlxA family transcriptional regulator [Falsiruegeria litorea]MBT8170032.1 GlxA family transcriptional regulator [Falsiruegeria litorea]RBW58637.1 GlxA family transcriptional regulator [Phaeobacter gallaeciensis]
MSRNPYVQKGASANFSVPFEGPPETFYFVLLPKATMLALAAAIEPLRIANQLTKKQLYTWHTMTEDGAPIYCSNGLRITPDEALKPLPSNAHAFVCAGVEPEKTCSTPVLNWIRREYRFGRSVGGICTGAFALAKAGLLGGQRFTLHWENQPGFIEAFPSLIPSPSIFESDGRITTCGGGNAAIDMMLALIEKSHGPQLAIMVADMCIHMRSGTQSPQRSSHSVVIGSRNPILLAAIELMQSELETPLTNTDLCDRLGISRRQLERLFKRYLGQGPMAYYLDLRISRAFTFLNETNMTVAEISIATGFANTSHLSRQFRAKYGDSPHSYRKAWS